MPRRCGWYAGKNKDRVWPGAKVHQKMDGHLHQVGGRLSSVFYPHLTLSIISSVMLEIRTSLQYSIILYLLLYCNICSANESNLFSIFVLESQSRFLYFLLCEENINEEIQNKLAKTIFQMWSSQLPWWLIGIKQN